LIYTGLIDFFTMTHHRQSFFQLCLLWLRYIINCLQSLIQNVRGAKTTLTFDSGRTVRVGAQVAEGGFSVVFLAHDANDHTRHYAVKRLHVTTDSIEQVRREAAVHRAVRHDRNCMPLLGVLFTDQQQQQHSTNASSSSSWCYLLFPLAPHSLRAELSKRMNQSAKSSSTLPPIWDNEVALLQLVLGVCRGVNALHQHHYSHCDIKPENILFVNAHSKVPLLTDFGSAGPLTRAIDTRRAVLELVCDASQQTTAPYRPPELFEGGVRTGDAPVDYAKVDVWSLGCTLWACMYGASPCESEFARDGSLRIVDCTQLRVISSVPTPPKNSAAASGYSLELVQLCHDMLTQDRHLRPSLKVVMERVEAMIRDKGGKVEPGKTAYCDDADNESDDGSNDGIMLLRSNRIV
jgi:serine/threonine kinase 16